MRVEEKKTKSEKKDMRKEEGWKMLVFFFQAEDGIRDTSVTGVQTCALPIYDP